MFDRERSWYDIMGIDVLTVTVSWCHGDGVTVSVCGDGDL
jgi:hypothetical protein